MEILLGMFLGVLGTIIILMIFSNACKNAESSEEIKRKRDLREKIVKQMIESRPSLSILEAEELFNYIENGKENKAMQ